MWRSTMVIVSLIMAQASNTEIIINNLSYDAYDDELVINVKYPGKCLNHTFTLEKTGSKDTTYRFYLSMNNTHDPCNGWTEKIERFSMGELTFRPAQVLISPNKDGSRPHVFSLPPHAKAHVLGAVFRDGYLEIKVKTDKAAHASQFYLDPQDACAPHIPCPTIIRDKKGIHTTTKLHIKQLRLPLNEVIRPITLSIATVKGAVAIYLPK